MYKTFIKTLLFYLFAFVLPWTPAAHSTSSMISIQEAFEAAIKNDDYSLKNKSIKKQSEARYSQAKSYLYPQLTLSGQYSESEFTDDATNVKTNGNTQYVEANLTQTLFQGGLFAGIQREKISKEIDEFEVKKNNLDLMLVVAKNFHKINLLEGTLETLNELSGVSTKRVGILKKRVSIGKSKKTDLLTNELQNQNLRIELEQTKTQLFAEREIFKNITGLPASSALKKEIEIPKLNPLESYLAKSHKTIDLEIQSRVVEVADKDLSIAKGQHLPKLYLDLSAAQGELTTTREGTEYVGLVKLEIPLFEGGRVIAEGKEARWKKQQESAKLNQLRRDTTVEIQNYYNNLKSKIDLYKTFDESVITARKNYQTYNREFDLGLVSNLEMLNSLNTYLSAKKNKEEAYYEIKVAEHEFARLIGGL